jgi:hypothetical protein
MKASTRQLSAVPATPEEHGNRADVPNILEEDEIKEIYLDRGEEDHLDESQDEAAEEDELEEEDEVGQAAQGDRS